MWSLKDMYKSEQASHISVEQETLRMSEKLGLAPAADYAGFNKKMAQALKATRHENQLLKEQLARLTASTSGPENGRYGQIPSERRSASSQSRTTQRAPAASFERRPRQQVSTSSSGRGVSVDRESSARRLRRVRNGQQRQQTDYSRSMPPQTQGNSPRSKPQINSSDRTDPRKERSSINRHTSSGTNRVSSAALRQSAPPTSRRERPIARIGRIRSGGDGHHL